MPAGSLLVVGTGYSLVMTPPVVIRPILLPSNSVNHSAPSGPAVMKLGPALAMGTGYSRMIGSTLSVADPPLPAPPLNVSGLVVLVLLPILIAVTLRVTRQLPLGATTPFERLMLLLPDVATTVPPHELTRPFGVVTTRPAGSVSVKATPVKKEGLPLRTVRVRLVLPSTCKVVTPNCLMICAKPVWTPAPRMTTSAPAAKCSFGGRGAASSAQRDRGGSHRDQAKR
jgi:hypothetical protein